MGQHLTRGDVLEGGKTDLCNHFGGAKATLFYVNHQFKNSVAEQKHSKFFILGALPPVPLAGTCMRMGGFLSSIFL